LLVWPPSRRKSPSSAPRIQLAFQVRPFLLMKGLLFGEAARRSGRYRRDESPAAATGSSVEQRLRRIVLRIASTCAAHSSRACSRGVAHGPRWQAQLRQPRRAGRDSQPLREYLPVSAREPAVQPAVGNLRRLSSMAHAKLGATESSFRSIGTRRLPTLLHFAFLNLTPMPMDRAAGGMGDCSGGPGRAGIDHTARLVPQSQNCRVVSRLTVHHGELHALVSRSDGREI
jgi:hypothetical protein